MKTLVLESPFSGELDRNLFYARLCTRDSVARGEAPFTPHLLYPTLTKDVQGMVRQGVIPDDSENSPLSRDQAFERIEAMRAVVDMTIFYVDLNYSSGMTIAKNNCIAKGLPYEERTLPGFAEYMKEYDDQRVMSKAGIIAAVTEMTGAYITRENEEHNKVLEEATRIARERKQKDALAEINRLHKATIDSVDRARDQEEYFALRHALEQGANEAKEKEKKRQQEDAAVEEKRRARERAFYREYQDSLNEGVADGSHSAADAYTLAQESSRDQSRI